MSVIKLPLRRTSSQVASDALFVCLLVSVNALSPR